MTRTWRGNYGVLLAVLSAAMSGLVNGQAVNVPDVNPRVVLAAPPESFTMRVVASGFQSPWELTSGPDGFLWVTERVGKRVTRVNPADGSRKVAVTIDDVQQSLAQDGLMGMTLHPELLRGTGSDFVYVAYTYDADPGSTLLLRAKIRRYTYDPATQTMVRPVDVITGLPHGTDHGGSRLVFGPDATLYLSRGDHGSNFLANYCLANRAQDLPTAAEVRAQDWSAYQGKILRINLDGSIPRDNPTINGTQSHVYSYGHRNPQGLAFANGGRLYASEHGESIDDELNLIRPGRNYGWPLIAGYRDDQSYTYANWSASSPEPCTALTFNARNPPASVPRLKESMVDLKDFTPPVRTFYTVPSGYALQTLGNATTAPAGLDVYTAPTVPGWRDSLLMTTMISGVVYRMKIQDGDGTQVGEPVPYFKTTNRYRDVAVASDGGRIYVVTDNDGRAVGADGALTRSLSNPGSLLEFTYAPSPIRGRPVATAVRERLHLRP